MEATTRETEPDLWVLSTRRASTSWITGKCEPMLFLRVSTSLWSVIIHYISIVECVLSLLFAQLTPFVTNSFQPTPTKYKYKKYGGRPRAFNGNHYIDLWKSTNAQEVQALRDNGGKFPEDDAEEVEAEERKTEGSS
jgi:hypothetical protein